MASTQPFKVNSRSVVVGVDDSDAALDAVGWAAREAASCGGVLLIVHAFVWPLIRTPSWVAHMGPAGGLRLQAEEILERAKRAALDAEPELSVDTRLPTGFPGPTLVEQSKGKACVVIGSRGRGAVGDVLAGSTALELVTQAEAPVVVVRSEPPPEQRDGPVVVGVDGSEITATAVEYAADFAFRHGRTLLAVHVHAGGHQPSAGFGDTSIGLRMLAESVAGQPEKRPDLRIEERVLFGHPAGALAELSGRASAIVVGSHGAGGFKGMLLGSVSQSLLHHARCPVVVIPHRLADPSQEEGA